MCPENTAIIEKANGVFLKLDSDEDGQLSPLDLQGFVQEMTNLDVKAVFSEEEQQQMFADLDIDGNGALSQEGNGIYVFSEQVWYHFT